MKVVTLIEGQTIVDIAIQEYGCYEGVLTLLEDNPDISLEDELFAGYEIMVQSEVEVINETNKQFQAQLAIKKGKVVTGIIGTEDFTRYVETDYWPDDYAD